MTGPCLSSDTIIRWKKERRNKSNEDETKKKEKGANRNKFIKNMW
jgi:hypothetical protein